MLVAGEYVALGLEKTVRQRRGGNHPRASEWLCNSGEATVLFTGVNRWLDYLCRRATQEHGARRRHSMRACPLIVQTIARLLAGMLFLFGTYIVLHVI